MDDWFNLNASIRRAVDPLALMQRVVDQVLTTLPGADGALVGLVIDDGSLRYVCGASCGPTSASSLLGGSLLPVAWGGPHVDGRTPRPIPASTARRPAPIASARWWHAMMQAQGPSAFST